MAGGLDYGSELGRLSRSLPDARAIAGKLERKGLKRTLGATVNDPSEPMGKMSFNIVATFAEFETDLIRMRTCEGMAIAKAKGKLKGKKPNPVEKQRKEPWRMQATGECSISDLAKVFFVSQPTVHRTLRRRETPWRTSSPPFGIDPRCWCMVHVHDDISLLRQSRLCDREVASASGNGWRDPGAAIALRAIGKARHGGACGTVHASGIHRLGAHSLKQKKLVSIASLASGWSVTGHSRSSCRAHSRRAAGPRLHDAARRTDRVDAERGDPAGQSGPRRCAARRSVMRPLGSGSVGCHAFSREFRIAGLSQIRSATPHSLAGLPSRRVTEQYRSSPRHWNRVPSTTPPAERCQWPKIQRSGW